MEKKKRVLAFGEVMLRIAMDNYQMLEQTKDARLNFTGTGLNVLSGISHFGHDTVLLTQLPDNRLGEAAKAEIRKLGISDRYCKQAGNHLGIYILEQGFGNRPSEVTYLDRIHSSFGISQWSQAEMAAAVAEVDLVHICGISLVLTEETRQAAFTLAKLAKAQNKQVCFDFNYRPSLNTTNELAWVREQYEKILPFADIVIGGERDLRELLGLEGADFQSLSANFIKEYQVAYFVGTNRSNRENQRYLTGFVVSRKGLYYSPEYPVYVFDRVGTGDAFAAGIITAVLEDWQEAAMVELATVSAVLSHTTLGDSPIVTRKQVELFIENQFIDIVR